MKNWFYKKLGKQGPTIILGGCIMFYGGWMDVKIPYWWVTIKWGRKSESRFSVVLSPDATPMHPKAIILIGRP